MLKAEAKYILIHIAVMLGSAVFSILLNYAHFALFLHFFRLLTVVLPVCSVIYGRFFARQASLKRLYLMQGIFFIINFLAVLLYVSFSSFLAGKAHQFRLSESALLIAFLYPSFLQIFYFISAMVSWNKIHNCQSQAQPLIDKVHIIIHITVMLGSLILYNVSSLIDKIAPLLLLPFFMIVFPVYSAFYGVFSTRTSNIKSLLLTQAIFFCINFISILSGMLIFKTVTERAAFTLSLLADYTIFSCVGSLVMQLFCFIPAIIRRAKIKRNEIKAVSLK